MNTLSYHRGDDALDVFRFILKCGMEKSPGVIHFNGEDYTISATGDCERLSDLLMSMMYPEE